MKGMDSMWHKAYGIRIIWGLAIRVLSSVDGPILIQGDPKHCGHDWASPIPVNDWTGRMYSGHNLGNHVGTGLGWYQVIMK